MNFFKAFLASCLGIFVSVVLLVIFGFILLIGSSSEPEPVVASNSVLTISLSGDIPAHIVADPLEQLINPMARQSVSLTELKTNLEKAAADERIKGVWVKTNSLYDSWANLEAAYAYFENYKNSGKFLYFSTDDIGMNEQSYYLASLADSIFLPPVTNFEFDGFVAQMTFYHDVLDKIGIQPNIFRVGKYKSAVEPFTQTQPSAESKEQMGEILEAAASTFVEAVAKRTGKTTSEINRLLNSEPVDRVDFALENGLVDAFAFEDDVEKLIKQRIGIDEDKALNTVSFRNYSKISESSAGIKRSGSFDNIAVIYASGTILPQLDGLPSGSNTITAADFQKQIDAALNNRNVKAIVVHINSPGGAVTTSDLLWNSIKKATEKKPVVAYMGNVAASGGYYMAMGADTIVAAHNTITGSIGIFNLLFNAQELLEDKFGLDFATIKTHEFADLYDLTRPFTPTESRIIQKNVDSGYEAFLSHVAESRNMTRDEVHKLAQGRVYTGAAAYEAGLIDELGTLDRALEIAAEMAGVDEYGLEIYPKQKTIMEVLYGTSNAKIKAYMLSWLPKSMHQNADNISYILNSPHAQNWALLPVHYIIE